ncbi:TPA: transcriptional regulator GutM [Salmonella enterica]|nr:hypothetical protein [Salmonella enterica]EBS0817826.1 hypothetical protein [Salmonella enterica subsp. enterica serovar Bareilly]EBO0051626.1 hypothetical protein [Salmonella enterica]EBV3565636.1 hypothetical protein [Salmonella enterica subsp. enterica serovar Bareilly]EBY5761747.1 hypothetical protein [Salmonella enterica subsp. enterica serovar Bareilly]
MVSTLITVAVIAWCAQLALDEQQRVTDTLLMKGLTVFARPVKIAAMQGKHLHELQPDVIFPHDSLAQNALSLALKLKHG